MTSSPPSFEQTHALAVERGDSFYKDPITGYSVFTELGLKKRGECCGAGCRHCPYEHARVPEAARAARIKQPALLSGELPSAEQVERLGGVRVIFWSGGKDSFLALCCLLWERAVDPASLVLLTTFDAAARKIAHQEVSVEKVVMQAEVLDLPLLGVPLHPGQDYLSRVRAGLSVLKNAGVPVRSLVFGDLHLEHVLAWRKEHLGPLGAEFGADLEFPILHVPYEHLLGLWERSGARAEVSATRVSTVKVGTRFDREFVSTLPEGVDAFGENGEFHTLVTPSGSAGDMRARPPIP